MTDMEAPTWFDNLLLEDPTLSTGLAAIKTLMRVLKECKVGTLQVFWTYWYLLYLDFDT